MASHSKQSPSPAKKPLSGFVHLKLWLASALIGGIIRLFGRSYRVRFVGESEARFDRFRAAGRPAVLAFWHDREFFCVYFLYRQMARRGLPLSAMVSHSRDGELGNKLGARFGVTIVRGSSSRGGTQGLRAMYRAVKKRRCSPMLTPDGPRGPAHRFKLGGVVLAQVAGIPVLPVCFAAERQWNLGSWDRMIIPRPFSRVAVAIGEPLEVPGELPGERLEQERMRLETALREQLVEVAGAFPRPAKLPKK